MLLLLASAHAATPTELPPMLRGDVSIGYTYDRLAGGLTEVDYAEDEPRQDVGSRRIEAHRLHYGLQFSVVPGVALYADIMHDASVMVTYDAWHHMVYEPSTQTGTYGSSVEQPAQTMADGGGIAGIWFGVKGTPFSSDFKKRPTTVTWLLDGGVRTPNTESNYWVVVEPTQKSAVGMRGGGPGGLGLRLQSTFSTKVGTSGEPYVGVLYQYDAPVTVKLLNDAGETLCGSCKVNPGDTFQLRLGDEVTLSKNDAGARYALDLHGTFTYVSWGTVPTGVFLPDVIVADAGSVQTAEQLEVGAGMRLALRPFTYMELGLRGDIAYHFPQRIEAPYPVYTGGDTIHGQAGVDLVIRIR